MKNTSPPTKSSGTFQGIGFATSGIPYYALAGNAMGNKPSSLTLRQDQNQTKETAKKLGIALVGLGKYSEGQLAPALQSTRLCQLVGIVTGSPHKEEEWKRKYGIPAKNVYDYSNFDRIKDNPDIDIVYIVLPNAMHAEFTIRGAKAGKHVICEKPMDVSVKACEEMIKACRENNRLLSIGYRLHFEPYNIAVSGLEKNKAYGKVIKIKAEYGMDIEPNVWRLNKALAGGGPLMDVGIYCVQAAIYADELDLLRAEAEKGWMELKPAYAYKGIKGKNHLGKLDFNQVNQQALQMDDFATCVMRKEQSKVPGEMGLRDVKILLAIYEASSTGKRIELKNL